MNYATIKTHDIANGPGIRVSLYVSGCTHHCKGCFNEEAWDFDYGQLFTEETERYIMKLLDRDYIKGLSLLGGEPFEPSNVKVLFPFLQRFREKYPMESLEKTLWCYSGYRFEELSARDDESNMMLQLIDVLVDGEFEEDKKVIDLRFRGSTNQRILLLNPLIKSV